MDPEIAASFGELERKLHELERALTAIGRGADGEVDGASSSREPTLAGGRLVDEAIERDSSIAAGGSISAQSGVSTARVSASATRAGDAQAGASTARARETTFHSTGPAGAQALGGRSLAAQPPDAAELLRFRDRLERTAQALTHDYDELLGRLRYAAVPAPPGPTISFARGAPSLDIIDVQGLTDAAARAFESDPGGTTAYGTAIGYPRLRAWIADRHGVEPERVLVTNGSMQADAFLFKHLVASGEEVVVERPTYDRTLLSLRERGARVHAVELQPDGIDTVALASLLGGRAGVRPKLAHIIPNFQNPAGYTLSLAKRQALLALAAQYGFIVFEDDPYVALRFRGESLPTMLSMDPERVVYASSFSKTVCPGIRVGYLVGPPVVIDAIAKIATNTYISPNMVSQSIVYEFCASGAIERSIETVRAALAERAATLAQALARELPDAELVEPEGGYFMWVTLPPDTDVSALHAAASGRGVAFVKGTDFVLEGGENTLRLAYAGVTPQQIDDGVARLAAAYRSL